MDKLRNRYLVLVLSTAALAAVGCGSSSKSKTTAKVPPAPSTPAPSTPSTPSTTSTALAGVSTTTPISDPRVRSLLIQGEQSRNQGRFSKAQLGNFADCLIKKLQAEGVKTLGQLQQHSSEASSLGRACAQSLAK